ncbi:hypothetical protein [Aurantiacibacter rhizosphaerae]|uniref:Lipoprotein n=1 Tax=Aurantiacibacter rhizosphaerae TaxID=2691582 RepID=A0A844X7U3_9SPHN|nr:hypothetical protein [Aurantiacibacter rhizosphaerae]MWV26407.1 hypothetical protein [Aurantiacibacter rhizosphaerae]
MRLIITLLTAASLSACTAIPARQTPLPPPSTVDPRVVPPTDAPAPPRSAAGFRAPEILQGPGLGGIIREPASSLIARFGQPRLDTPEGDMHKLQFKSDACVMDVYLYPLSPGAQPVATWIEARRASDGAAVDRVACIQALSRRR